MIKRYGDATGHDLYFDAPLSEIVINFTPPATVADEVFPRVEVRRQSDVYFVFSQADLWRIDDYVRAPGTAPKVVDFGVSSQTYFAKNFAARTFITVEDLANTDVLGFREEKARMLMTKLTLKREFDIAALLTNSSNVGTVQVVTSGTWTNFSTANVLVDVQRAIDSVRASTGFTPNTAVFGYPAYTNLKYNNTIRSLVFPAAGGATGPGIPTPSQLATLFGLERVLIGGAMFNSGAEGFDFSPAEVWGPHGWVFYRPPGPSRTVPSYGYTFDWNPGGQVPRGVSDFYDPKIKSHIMDLMLYWDYKIVSAPLCTWISSVL